MKKRCAVVTIVFFWLLVAAAGRLLALSTEDFAQVAAGQGSISLQVQEERGTIYDCNGNPITNARKVYKATLTATPEVSVELYRKLPREEADAIIERLRSGKPIVAEVTADFSANGAQVFECYEYYSEENLAPHIIGYRDSVTGEGISGIEKAFDSLLSRSGEIRVRYSTNARGGALLGVEPEIIRTGGENASGVVLTLDSDVQRVVNEVARQYLTAGAVVVLDASGEHILASVSMPDFSPNNLAAAMEAENSPFINRAFTAYNSGSVFKLCIAAAALEAGIDPSTTFSCSGQIDCEGVTIHCHKKEGHGTLDMAAALSESCNTYFIQLAQQVGAAKVYEMADRMGFGKANQLAPGYTASGGNLPDLKDLNASLAALANFSIGQGELLTTPLQIASMTAAIVNGGAAPQASLVLGTKDENGILTPYETKNSVRAMSQATAAQLREMMVAVVSEGTGSAAMPETGGAGGKTATAETGWKSPEGDRVVQAWFTGFYPAETPQYIITIIAEDAASGSSSAAPIFKAIADGLAKLG